MSSRSGTLFVTSQDPDLEACTSQVGDSLWNTILQLVLDGSRSNQRHSYLDLFIHLGQPFLAVLKSNAATDVIGGILPGCNISTLIVSISSVALV